MKEKISGYLLIALLNVFILFSLLWLYTDKLERLLNRSNFFEEAIKIVLFNLCALLIVCLFLYAYSKKLQLKTKLLAASILTLVISSFLYSIYIKRFIHNRIINGRERDQLAAKMHRSAQKISAAGLNFQEYHLLAAKYGLRTLPLQASRINLDWETYELLPDYYYCIHYNIPCDIVVDTFNHSKGSWSQYQSVRVAGRQQQVTYEETRQ